MMRLLCAATAIVAMAGAPAAAKQSNSQVALETLLAADRAFGTSGARAPDPVSAMAPMLAADVAMAVSGRQYMGRDAVLAALRESASFREGSMKWAPIRGGISADGTHGFTFGYMSVNGGEAARRERKYLSYWIKRPEGWRVLAHRQTFREPGEVSTAMLAPSLPGFTAKPKTSANLIASHNRSLAAAEQAFSDHAQRVGRRAAFYEVTRPDGMLMGGGTGFTIGREAVSGVFPADEKASPMHWSTERSYVASSGDLGISIGSLRFNAKAEGQPETIPFFTVWRRDGANGRWRLIAE